ncbi:MAG TPA: polyprenyl synthetase family protein [Atribacteraceae bacterium]|nr:polyprenyl synthetase family protein [Atribacteraceae bacterium]
MSITEYLDKNADFVDDFLDRHLNEPAAPSRLIEAMRYGVLKGGKKIRASLLFATGEAFSITLENLLPLAAAIEMIHSFSLVHDDLPSIDNDDFRRGKPSLHRAYNEGMGVLAGDALLVDGLRLIVTDQNFTGRFGLEKGWEIVGILLEALGSAGMVGGQVFDIENEGRQASWDEVRRIYRMKTAGFIQAPILCAAVAGGCSPGEKEVLSRFGLFLGECFQMVDDLLDISQPSKRLGKTAGKDLVQQKATLVRLFGTDRTREFLDKTYREALSVVSALDRPLDNLLAIAAFIVERNH